MAINKITCGVSTGSELADSVNLIVDSGVNSSPPPVGFNVHSKLSSIVANKSGDNYSSNLSPSDIIDLSVYTNIQYVDLDRPDSSGDGTSWALAERNIGTAIDNAMSIGLDTRIFVKGGVYHRFQSITQNSVAKNLTVSISLEAVHGRVTTGPFDDLTYTKTIGKTNVYESNRSAALIAVNLNLLDDNGDYSPIAMVGSITECDNTPNSWFTDNTLVYVHEANSGVVTNTNTRIYLGVVGAALYGNKDIYISGFNLEGGNSGALDIRNGTTNNVVINNTKCNYASGGTISAPLLKSGVAILDCDLFASFNSSSSYNSNDGFNFHIFNGKKPTGLLVNCSSRNNGILLPGATSVNGITAHDGISIIDIGGLWTGSAGTNSGHVNNDTQLWSVGSIAGDSQGDTINGGTIFWGAYGAWNGTAELWLDNCVDVNSDVGLYAQDGGKINIRNHKGSGKHDGNVVQY